MPASALNYLLPNDRLCSSNMTLKHTVTNVDESDANTTWKSSRLVAVLDL